MKIAELSRVSGTHRSTIHHYVALGLLPRPETLGPRLHHFGPAHLERLSEIQRLRAEGLGLADIRERISTRRPARATSRRPRRPGREHQDRRAAILDAAARLFHARGFDRASMQAVARAAGVGKATLYKHFVGKRELFVECLDRLRFTLVPADERARIGATLAFHDEARLRAHAVLSRFDAYRTITDLLAAAAHGRDPEVAARAREALHRMVTNAEPSLRRAMTTGSVRPGDSELWAYMLWGALLALGDRLALDDRYSLPDALAAYHDFMTHATAPPAR